MNQMVKKAPLLTALLLLAGISITPAVLAHGASSPDKRHGPPKEAIEACEGQVEGDQVIFNTPRGDSLKGTCKKVRNRLIAVPNDPEKRPPKPHCRDEEE